MSSNAASHIFFPISDPWRRKAGRTGSSLACSALLHGALAAAALLTAPVLMRDMPPPPQPIPVDLVRMADATELPPAPVKAIVPQEKAGPVSMPPEAEPAKLAQAPLPSAETHEASLGRKPAATELPARRKVSVAAITPREPVRSPPKPVIATPSPSPPRAEDGVGASNVAATSANAALGSRAHYDVKDYFRAQIERRWHFDVGQLGNTGWVVSVHLEIDGSGHVSRAEVVDNPALDSNAAYHALAISARDAVLVSSPLQFPPGVDDVPRDMTLAFDPKDVLR